MSPKTRFFLKIAIRTGVLFTLAMVGFMLLFFAMFLPISKIALPILAWGLLSGVLFGGLFSFVITIMQVNGLKKIGETEFTDETLSVVQTKTIQTKLSLTEIIAILERTKKFNQIKIITPQKKIKITSGISLKSWRELVEITLKDTQDLQNTFEIMSRPSLKTTMADYGKNRQNVLELEHILLGKDDLSEHLIA